jgi:hypothetical protein
MDSLTIRIEADEVKGLCAPASLLPLPLPLPLPLLLPSPARAAR